MLADAETPPNSSDRRADRGRVVNANDVWAVGRHTRTEGTRTIYDPLIVHWDGARWDTVHLPDWSRELMELDSIDALAPDDIWVGGNRLIHWNGKEWSQVDLPVSDFAVSDFSATSESNVWAAAGKRIFHWNGKEWSVSYTGEAVGTGQMSFPIQFASIKATSATDAWAVGGINIPTNCGASYDYLYHWDGITWTKVEEIGIMPGPCGGGYFISSLSALAADNVWLLEGFVEGRTLKHWDGSVWTEFSCPEQGSAVTNMPGHPKQFINKILAMDDNNVWLLGSFSFPNDGPTMDFTKDWSSRGWIMQAYLGECLLPTPTPSPGPYLPPTPISTITPTHDSNVPENVSTVPWSVPSGIVPVQTGVVPVSP